MNSLSWLIYLSGIVESVDRLFIFFTIISGIVGALAMVAYIIESSVSDSNSPLVAPLFRRVAQCFIPAFLFFGLCSAFLPSRQTVLMIAASEMGQRALMSQQVQSVVDPATAYLRTWLESETARLRQPPASR